MSSLGQGGGNTLDSFCPSLGHIMQVQTLHRFKWVDCGAYMSLETYSVLDVTLFSKMLPFANGASFLTLSGCSKPPQ